MRINGKKILGISDNSKSVKKDFIFVAVKGTRQDGRRFIQEAVDKKACLVAVEGKKPEGNVFPSVTFLEVKDSRSFLALAASEFYGFPSDKIKVAGITGTNGKTTVAYLLEAILKAARIKCGVVGTVNYRYGNKVFKARNTTPGPVELNSMLSSMLKSGALFCAMEVSSHALDQQRVGGIYFHSAIFTNLTCDHLDYHKDMESYFQAKTKLFRGLNSRALAVVNTDDEYGRRIVKSTCAKLITYGIKNKADVMAKNIRYNIQGTNFLLLSPSGKMKIKSRLIGEHNVYNLLAAASWGLGAGVSLEVIKRAVGTFIAPPGRLERVGSGAQKNIFVDYAHTDDALYNVLSALRPLCKGKIILIFGCGGDRDKGKRPKMGAVSEKLADKVIITNDNPRSEDPLEIIKDIKKGLRKANARVITDRAQAIKAGLDMAGREDILLIAGKGHEDYQIIGNNAIHFDDKEEVKKCLRSAN
ncbi:MAG: UDP-N-acetylmuramoyl-L-alanyl-D-glutamate--2,6-diaminopimelate ligase [Candidatus Omnitrophota bacterium]